MPKGSVIAGPLDFGPIDELGQLLFTFIVFYVLIPLVVGMICAGIYVVRVPREARSGLALSGVLCAGLIGGFLAIAAVGFVLGAGE